MKLWVDDLRPPPDDSWWWAKTSKRATAFLYYSWVTQMSLDHDLGIIKEPRVGDQLDLFDDGTIEDTTRPIVLYMCEHGVWPDEVTCHSSNPPGREWIEGMIARYQPK